MARAWEDQQQAVITTTLAFDERFGSSPTPGGSLVRASAPCVPMYDEHMPTFENIVHVDPEILGGTPVFRGTRVPVKNLLDYLAAGDTLDQFLDDCPTVKREQAVAALELARDLLTAGAHTSR
jgi:uncharacterized protein (DUF433 family)